MQQTVVALNSRSQKALPSDGWFLVTRWTMILVVIIGCLSSAEAQQNFPKSGSLVVDAKSNIFWAGQEPHVNPPDGIRPQMILIPKGMNRYIEFTVTGETDCGLGVKAGPDGGTCGQRTNVESSMKTGIGGLVHNNKTMFLTGVFLSDEAPPSFPNAFPPVKFDYTQSNRTAVPNHVTFIIGDGLIGTGQGERQRFPVPPSATRLFLGFVDGSAGSTVEGVPGGYDNNSGSLSVQYRINGQAGEAAPEGPAALVPTQRTGDASQPLPVTTPVTVTESSSAPRPTPAPTTPATDYSVIPPPSDSPPSAVAADPKMTDPPPIVLPARVLAAPRACPENAPVSVWSNCSGVFFDTDTVSNYAGEFLNGQYHGVGVLRSRDGIYTGSFIAGRFEGLGIFTAVDGRRYVGQFVAGSIAGVGRLLDAQGGEVFSGQFVDGLPQVAASTILVPDLPKRPQVPASSYVREP